MEINKNVFREYDIRGVYPTDINEEFAYTFGKAFGSYIRKKGKTECVIGHDNRLSSDSLYNNLIQGILESGVDLVSLGLCTTPMYYFACIKLGISPGVMVTASHNPKDDNGFKFAFDEKGNAKGDEIQEFMKFMLEGEFLTGFGKMRAYDIKEEYYEYLLDYIEVDRKLKVVIDAGNGTTSEFAKELFGRLDIELVPLFCESDPTFPNHHPDPAVEENLEALKKKVVEEKADVGIAFDGDGDRIGVVDEKGNYISADKFMIIVSRYLIPISNNKKILYDVKCSKALTDEISKLKGIPVISRTGNSYTKANTKAFDCIFGGEYSGHVYFRDKFMGFDSAMYAGLRLLEILSKTGKAVSVLLEGINEYYSTPEIKIPCSDDKKKKVVKEIEYYLRDNKCRVVDVDGIRCEYSDGWGLVRCSNTGPNLTVRFEGRTIEARDRIQKEFMELIEKYNK